jgi:outer membrane protein assembly factor BamE (lipoprotein component of BamABCDE complex)
MRLVDLIPLKEMYNPAEAFNKKVSRMTNDNDHSSAAVELAIYLDDRDAVSKLQKIKRQHDKDGSISPEDAKKRDKMVDDLLKKAKKDLTNKDYTLVSDSF